MEYSVEQASIDLRNEITNAHRVMRNCKNICTNLRSSNPDTVLLNIESDIAAIREKLDTMNSNITTLT